MMKRFWSLAAMLGAVLALTVCLGHSPAADEPDKEKIEKNGTTVRDIALAYELYESAKTNKSALQMATAASILRGVSAFPSKTKPKIELGKDVKPDPNDEKDVEPISYKEESDRIFKEAKTLAGDDKLLGDLIESERNKKSRSSGSPRSYTRAIRPGVTHTYPVTMYGGTFSRVSVSGNGRFTLTVTGDGGIHQGSLTGPAPFMVWTPSKTHGWSIQVTNSGAAPATYTMVHN